jgi:hypothetical protein
MGGEAMQTTAEKMLAFIDAHLEQGRTVYAQNHAQIIPIKRNKRDLVRISDDRKHVEVCKGKRWESIMGMKMVAK